MCVSTDTRKDFWPAAEAASYLSTLEDEWIGWLRHLRVSTLSKSVTMSSNMVLRGDSNSGSSDLESSSLTTRPACITAFYLVIMCRISYVHNEQEPCLLLHIPNIKLLKQWHLCFTHSLWLLIDIFVVIGSVQLWARAVCKAFVKFWFIRFWSFCKQECQARGFISTCWLAFIFQLRLVRARRCSRHLSECIQ